MSYLTLLPGSSEASFHQLPSFSLFHLQSLSFAQGHAFVCSTRQRQSALPFQDTTAALYLDKEPFYLIDQCSLHRTPWVCCPGLFTALCLCVSLRMLPTLLQIQSHGYFYCPASPAVPSYTPHHPLMQPSQAFPPFSLGTCCSHCLEYPSSSHSSPSPKTSLLTLPVSGQRSCHPCMLPILWAPTGSAHDGFTSPHLPLP